MILSSLKVTWIKFRKFSSLFLLADNRISDCELSGFSKFYRSSFIQYFLFAPTTASTTLWATACCSCMSLDFVGIGTGDNFSPLPKTKVFWCNEQLILQSHELVRICASYCESLNQAKILLSSVLNTLNLTCEQLKSILNKKILHFYLEFFQSPHNRYKLTFPRKK